MTAIGPVVASWLLARVLIVMAWATFGRHPLDYAGRPVSLRSALIAYDGTFYSRIAREGYPHCRASDFSCVEVRRFFPFAPALARGLAAATGLSTTTTMIVLGNLAALVATLLVWRLLAKVSSAEVASCGVWILTLYPAAAVFSFGYTESLGVMLTSITLLAISAGATSTGLVGGFTSGLLRPTGVLVAIPPFTDFVTSWRARRPDVRLLAVALSPVVGMACFLTYLGVRDHDAFAPMRIQSKLRAGLRDPFTRLASALWHTLTVNYHDAYNLALALTIIAALVLGLIRWRSAIPAGWWWLALAGLVISLSAVNIDSVGRYALAYFPAWTAALALELAPRKRVLWGVLAIELVAYFGYAAAVMHHSVIP